MNIGDHNVIICSRFCDGNTYADVVSINFVHSGVRSRKLPRQAARTSTLPLQPIRFLRTNAYHLFDLQLTLKQH